MRYYVKSKFLKIKEDFWVKNDDGEECFFVDKQFFSWGLQFRVLKNNAPLYSVKEKLLKFLPSYEINDTLGRQVATVSKKLTFFKDSIAVNSVKGDLSIQGDFWHYRYKIIKNGRVIGNVNKEFLAFTDNYYVDINYEDEAFVIALVVIIDNIIDKRNNSN